MTSPPAASGRLLAAAVAWTVLTAVLLTVPGSYVPGPAWSYDKVGHLGMFAGFGFLWTRALRGRVRFPAGWTSASGFLYATLSEVVQSMMPGERTGDPMDALANLAGLAAGVLTGLIPGLTAARHARRISRGPGK